MQMQYHKTISERDDLAWIRDVTLLLQKKVLAEFGYNDEPGLRALHNARAQYLDDEEMNKLTVYQRRDRSREGKREKEKKGFYFFIFILNIIFKVILVLEVRSRT